jgi:hypothetical protein
MNACLSRMSVGTMSQTSLWGRYSYSESSPRLTVVGLSAFRRFNKLLSEPVGSSIALLVSQKTVIDDRDTAR